jgi:hypothetical protein
MHQNFLLDKSNVPAQDLGVQNHFCMLSTQIGSMKSEFDLDIMHMEKVYTGASLDIIEHLSPQNREIKSTPDLLEGELVIMPIESAECCPH